MSWESRSEMKILVICQHYWPEPYPLTSICEHLADRGHEVHVITDVPNYPMGYIYDEYKQGKNRNQTRNGVMINRTFTIGRRKNIVFRMLNYFSYAISSTRYVRKLKDEYDVVFTNQSSPIMMVNAAMVYAKKHKKKAVLYCMDLWPASLAAGGVEEGSLIYKFFEFISRKLYRKADRILITSKMFRSYLEEKFDISDDVIDYLPQYADARFRVMQEVVKKDTVDLVFAGNVGTAQSIDTIIRAARVLKDEKNLVWHIVGDGSELDNLKNLAAELKVQNVRFHGRKPIEEMPKYYGMADAMLVCLTADPFISLTLPNKVQTYMAAGKPIIAAANGEIHNVIHESGCGFCAEAEDVEGLARAVREFLYTKDKKELGRNARIYYEKHFTQEMFLEKLETELKKHCTK